MDWTTELAHFAAHAAAAAVAVWLVLGPCRPWLARVVARIGAARRGRVIAAAVLVTVVVRGSLMPVVQPAYATDVAEYCDKAAAIATDGHPRAQETRADGTRFYRTLGWSLPLAAWYRVTGMPESHEGRLRAAQALNVLVAAAVAALLVLLGAAIGHETAGRVAAFGYALYLPAATFSLIPYTETWATLLVVASALLFERLLRADGRRALALGAAFGAAQGLLLVTRTEFAWMPALAAALLVRGRGRAAVAPILAGVLLAAVPFAVSHQMRDGYPGHLRTSVQSGLILYYGNNAFAVTGQGNATEAVRKEVAAMYAEDPTGRKARDAALAWMKSHPLAVAANAPKKLYHLWLAEPQGLTWQLDGGADRSGARVLLHAAWVQSLVLLALAVIAIARRTPVPAFWLSSLALHAATWCLLAASARNRYPLEPLLLIAAATWLVPRVAGIAQGGTGSSDAALRS
jgi:hypothetical protein